MRKLRYVVLPYLLVAGAACSSSDAGTSGGGTQDAATDSSAASDAGATDAAATDGATDSSAASDAGDGSATVARGCPPTAVGCYTVYAHTDHALYVFNLATSMIERVGPFNAPTPDGGTEDVMTDLAVTPDDQIWVTSATKLYNANPVTGQVTVVGSLATCGMGNVALVSDAMGKLYVGDPSGSICSVDTTTHPPTVAAPGTLGGGYALAGDMVTVSDGTTYATGYLATMPMTLMSNVLLTLDLASPATAHSVGSIGFGRLFGVAFGLGKVIAFAHDGSGQIVSIDPATAQATSLGPFHDSVTNQLLVFAGAGVNPRVSKTGH